MNFYGVGVRFGGTDDMWKLFSDKNCWFMGYHEDEKPRLDKYADSVEVGDILIAKAYGTTSQSDYYVRAIGIVTNTQKPDDIPEEYKDRTGFTVAWVKYFEKAVPLSAKEYERGGVHTYTIFKDKNDEFISKIIEMMKYDYKAEVLL